MGQWGKRLRIFVYGNDAEEKLCRKHYGAYFWVAETVGLIAQACGHRWTKDSSWERK